MTWGVEAPASKFDGKPFTAGSVVVEQRVLDSQQVQRTGFASLEMTTALMLNPGSGFPLLTG
jgi:hypothetical protein